MADRLPEVERREIRLPDGRRLVYYPMPPGEAPPPPDPAPPPRREG